MKAGDRIITKEDVPDHWDWSPLVRIPRGIVGVVTETDPDDDGELWIEFDGWLGEWVHPRYLRPLRTLELLARCADEGR